MVKIVQIDWKKEAKTGKLDEKNILRQEAKEVSPHKYITKYQETTYTIFTQKESIEKVVYRDKLDNAVEILFSNQTTNLFLDDELFKAEIPRGYDIVRE